MENRRKKILIKKIDQPDIDQLEKMFYLLYRNMSQIAPSGMAYEEDYQSWLTAVSEGFRRPERSVLLIMQDNELVGYFQYYVNPKASVFMTEEIQFEKKVQGSGLFRELYARLADMIPEETETVEAYAHKNNFKSQKILEHLGLHSIGEGKDGRSIHYRGSCKDMLGKYRNRQEGQNARKYTAL